MACESRSVAHTLAALGTVVITFALFDSRCSELRTGATNIAFTEELMAEIDELQTRMGANGLRVLGMAEKQLEFSEFILDKEYVQDWDKLTEE